MIQLRIFLCLGRSFQSGVRSGFEGNWLACARSRSHPHSDFKSCPMSFL
jgi:hypothetical protein